MAKINLRDYYPDFYKYDYTIDVPEDVLAVMLDSKRQEAAYERCKYRHKAHYSLDRNDGIERDILFVSLAPDEIYERRLSEQQLHAAIASLPDKQAKRIYAFYFMGMSKAAIAQAEGVDERVVRTAIHRGLRNIEKYLKKFL